MMSESDLEARLIAVERKLEKLDDIEAIKRLRAVYSRGCDANNDLEILMPLFTEDAVISLNKPFSGRYEGTEQLREMFVNNVKLNGVGWTVHFYLQPVIDVAEDGLTAKASWYLWETAMMRLDGPDQEAVWVAGFYNDEYRKVDGVWKFTSIEINMLLLAEFEKGWKDQKVFGSA